MRKIITTAAAIGAAAILAAGCGSAKPAASQSSVPAAETSAPASDTASLAATNERALANDLAASVVNIPAQLVAGTVMAAYAELQDAASARVATCSCVLTCSTHRTRHRSPAARRH